MLVREPVVAGQFYPGTREACLKQIEALGSLQLPADLPERPVAGIVPHAGWTFSGATALAVMRAIGSRRTPRTFVLFGAVHRRIPATAIFSTGRWETPLGPVDVDEWLAGEILARTDVPIADEPRAHEAEHSLEVQLPLLRHEFPEAKIVPLAVLPEPAAADVGRAVGRTIRTLDADAACLGSTDLTHYGPMYGFAPRGLGTDAVRWVREENDRRMVDLMQRLDAGSAVEEASERANACGSGAVAATLAAASELGAERGVLVHYTTSYDVMASQTGRADAGAVVGYAGVVF